MSNKKLELSSDEKKSGEEFNLIVTKEEAREWRHNKYVLITKKIEEGKAEESEIAYLKQLLLIYQGDF